MEVTLDPELRAFIEATVAGEYTTPSDALNAAVSELRRRNEYRDCVRSAIAESEAARARGEGKLYSAEDTSRLANEVKAQARARCEASAHEA